MCLINLIFVGLLFTRIVLTFRSNVSIEMRNFSTLDEIFVTVLEFLFEVSQGILKEHIFIKYVSMQMLWNKLFPIFEKWIYLILTWWILIYNCCHPVRRLDSVGLRCVGSLFNIYVPVIISPQSETVLLSRMQQPPFPLSHLSLRFPPLSRVLLAPSASKYLSWWHCKVQLRIQNWNARDLSFHLLEFQDFFSKHNGDVACIAEFLLVPTKKIFIPGFWTYRDDWAGGRGVILVRLSIKFSQSPISISAPTLPIPNAQSGWQLVTTAPILSEDKTNRVFQSNCPVPTIEDGDSNAQHVLWNCRQTNLNRVKLVDHSIQKDLIFETSEAHTGIWDNRRQISDIVDISMTRNIHFPTATDVFSILSLDHELIIMVVALTPVYTSLKPCDSRLSTSGFVSGRIPNLQTTLDLDLWCRTSRKW